MLIEQVLKVLNKDLAYPARQKIGSCYKKIAKDKMKIE